MCRRSLPCAIGSPHALIESVSPRGVDFALVPKDVEKLRHTTRDSELLSVIQDDIEERRLAFDMEHTRCGHVCSLASSSIRGTILSFRF